MSICIQGRLELGPEQREVSAATSPGTQTARRGEVGEGEMWEVADAGGRKVEGLRKLKTGILFTRYIISFVLGMKSLL